MSVPTKSAISALPPPGAQRKKAGAVRVLLVDDGVAVPNVPEGALSDELAALPIPVVPVLVVLVPVVPIPVVLEGARAVGWMLETLTLGGVASNRMLVVGLDGEKAGAGATLAAGPALVAATAGLVAVVVVVVEPVVPVPGSGIAPDTDSGGVPGGGAGGLVVVDVDVEVDVDCASAGLAIPKNSAAPIASPRSITADIASTPCKRTRRTEERSPAIEVAHGAPACLRHFRGRKPAVSVGRRIISTRRRNPRHDRVRAEEGDSSQRR
jgi:hypothetical protein